jgi:hypothetical protein
LSARFQVSPNSKQALIGYKGQQGYASGPLNGQGQCTLVFRAGTGNTPGKDLAPIGNKTAKGIRVFIVDLQLLGTEFADLLLKINLTLAPAIIAVTAVYITAPIHPGAMLTVHIFFVKHNNSSNFKLSKRFAPKARLRSGQIKREYHR